jgi:mRNA-degrading endonuclease toxin of MazEF toxin-antitoxin module
MNTLNRGDIVRVDFPDEDEIPSSEFDSPHPAVVVQNDTANNRLETATVVPVTTSGYNGNDYQVRLFPDCDGVEEESVAKANLIATVSISDRIINEEEWKMGEISPKKTDELEAAIRSHTSIW